MVDFRPIDLARIDSAAQRTAMADRQLTAFDQQQDRQAANDAQQKQLMGVKQAVAGTQILMDTLKQDESGQAFEQMKGPILTKLSETLGMPIDIENATPQAVEELYNNALIDYRSMASPQEASAFVGFGQGPEAPYTSKQSDLDRLTAIGQQFGKDSDAYRVAESSLVPQSNPQREYKDYLTGFEPKGPDDKPLSFSEYVTTTARERAAATTRGQREVQVEFDNLKTLDQNLSAIEASYNVTDLIKSAIEGANMWNTGWGSMLASIPGSSAKDLQSVITTVKGNIGFDRLQRMRSESPTGGALGNVANQELEALQATIASLDQSQSTEQFKNNMRRVLIQYGRWQEAWGRSIMKEGTRDQKARYYNAVPEGGTYEFYDPETDSFVKKIKSGRTQ